MNWICILILYFVPLLTSNSFAEEAEASETTLPESNSVSNEIPSSSDNPVNLDSNLRNALLKALSELESDDNGEIQFSEENEKNIERAQASTITLFANDNEPGKIENSDNLLDNHNSNEKNQIITTFEGKAPNNQLQNSESLENSSENSDNTPSEIANEIIVQKSNAIQSVPITSIEKEPLDFFKNAEQIITSASNSFVTENGELINSQTPRSIKDTESDTKITSFSNLNSISDFDSKTESKTYVDKLSVGKEVVEPPFVKTYIRPLGNDEEVAYVKPAETYIKLSDVYVNSKTSVNSDVNVVENGDSDVSKDNGGSTEATTAAAVEISTEENEAKVEQVQFFTAPLVAAFTVHQDEKGQPKKVVPIYKNELNPKKEISVQQNIQQQTENLQSSTFSNADLQKKQQLLEQELEKLRNQQLLQQERLVSRNNFGSTQQSFANQVSNNQVFTQSGFKQAINQNFNQYDPIFSEPDRSIVTKLATIDPSSLLAQNGGPVLSKFTPSEAILPITNTVKPNLQNSNIKGDVNLIPSITYNPIIEAEKLPLNAQILPNKEPTGFRNFLPQTNTQIQEISPIIQNSVSSRPIVSLSNTNLAQSSSSISQVSPNLIQSNSNLVKPSSNFVQSNFNGFSNNGFSLAHQNLAQSNQNILQPTSNIIQPSISNFVSSGGQNNGQIPQNSNFLGNQVLGQVQSPSNGLLTTNSESSNFLRLKQSQNNNFLTSNRILRQEQGSGNFGLNQNTFSIIPAREPFNPIHEIGYFPDNNKFLRQNQGATNFNGQNLASQNFSPKEQNTRFLQTNLDGTRNIINGPNPNLGFQGAQNQNRLFRSNLEGSATNANNLNNQQNIQQFGQQSLNYNPQNHRFLKTNQEGNLNGPQNFGNVQNVGFSQPQNFAQIDQNNRFLRSNLENTFLSNQNRFSSQPTLQNYKYSNSFGFRTVPLNKK